MATLNNSNRDVGSIIITGGDGVETVIDGNFNFIEHSNIVTSTVSEPSNVVTPTVSEPIYFSAVFHSPLPDLTSDPAPSASTPSSEDTLPASICPVCGSSLVEISDGHGHCNDCGSQFSLGGSVTAYSFEELAGGMEEFAEEFGEELIAFIKEEKQQYPIIKYKDIVSDRRNRFRILDFDDIC